MVRVSSNVIFAVDRAPCSKPLDKTVTYSVSFHTTEVPIILRFGGGSVCVCVCVCVCVWCCLQGG